MKRNKTPKRKNKKLVFSLTRNYILFLFIMAGIFVTAYIISDTLSSKLIDRTSRRNAVSYIPENSDSIAELDFNKITDMDGMVQILDKNKVVIKQYGKLENLKAIKSYYTEEELLEILSVNNESEYISAVNTVNDKVYGKVTLLFIIPKTNVDYQINLFNAPYSVSKEYVNLYLKILGITIVLYVLIIIVYSIWTTKKISAPLRKIDETLGKIIDGDYSAKVDLKGANEFIVVGQTINYLTYKLEKSFEENKQLEESKNKMILDLSHDIKTPITTIKGFSTALYQGLITDEHQKIRYYKTIANKSERVEELINDLFDYVKLNNKIHINTEKIDLCEYMREIILKYIDEFEEREFELDIDIQDEPIFFEIDTKLFQRAIVNLLENALKYNPNGTKLRVTVLDKKTYILIEIADNGVGIPKKVRPVIFDAFVRGDESRKTDGGTGLGLSITQKIINMHNGDIILRSDEKEVTIFTIQLHI